MNLIRESMIQLPREISTKLLLSCLFVMFVLISQDALAEYRKPKNSENDAPRAESSDVAAIRSTDNCSRNNEPSLTTLAPESHTGQTVSTTPTFAWYIPFQNASNLHFTIYEHNSQSYQNKGKRLIELPMISKSGIMTYSLPAINSLLKVGKKYVWEVEVLCNSSQMTVINSEILVVRKPDRLAEQINNTRDPIDKANVYAQAGLWYDALAEVALQPEDPQAQILTRQFIQQLAEIEGDDAQTKAIAITEGKGEQLNRIAEVLQNN